MGVSKLMCPRHMVAIHEKNSTVVGMAIITVISPKKAFTLAPAPMVKKWCNQTDKASTDTPIIAMTLDV